MIPEATVLAIRRLRHELAPRFTIEHFVDREVMDEAGESFGLPLVRYLGFRVVDRLTAGVLVHAHRDGRGPPAVRLELITCASGYLVIAGHATAVPEPYALFCAAADRAVLRSLGWREGHDRWSTALTPALESAPALAEMLERTFALDWRVLDRSRVPAGTSFGTVSPDLRWLVGFDRQLERRADGDRLEVVRERDGETARIVADPSGVTIEIRGRSFRHPEGLVGTAFARACLTAGLSIADLPALPAAR